MLCQDNFQRFNPCKGFGGFGTKTQLINANTRLVSIPVRVLGVLEPGSLSTKAEYSGSFNPCKGFGGFGTPKSNSKNIQRSSFNPCKGFGGFGTNHSGHRCFQHPCFNPCKGFGGFGTSFFDSSHS